MRSVRAVSWTAGVLLCATTPLRGATFDVSYRSMERILVQRVLSEGGRYYLEGDAQDQCHYAFVQEPRIDAQGERLRVTLLFAGRAGREIAGRCVGAGDNFDVVVSGVPTFANGVFYLAELEIDAPDTAYFRLVAPLIRRHLENQLRYPARLELEGSAALLVTMGYGRVAWDAITVNTIQLGGESLRIDFDFALSLVP